MHKTLTLETQTIGVLSYAKDADVTKLILSEGVEIIGAKAFSQCENLRTVCLPRSLTHIDMKAFELCPLEDIHYAGTERQWAGVEISPQGSEPISSARKHFIPGDPAPSVSIEDRKEEIFRSIRTLLAQGGDGRFHIAAPDLCMDGILTKPGDLTFLIFPQGSTMLIDTGYFKNLPKVMDFLEGCGIRSLDYLVFSHADGDHVSNARAITETIIERWNGSIRHFWWTGQNFSSYVPDAIAYLRAHGTELDLEVRAGRSFTIDGVQVEILGPTEEDMAQDPADGEVRNSQSMMMKFTYGAASYLTCGDLYAAQEKTVVHRLGSALNAAISKTNHHGCFTSNTKEWMDAVGGKIIFSCSNDNGSTALVQDLEDRGVDYYSTGCQGTLLISADREGTYEVLTQYGRGLRCSQRVN